MQVSVTTRLCIPQSRLVSVLGLAAPRVEVELHKDDAVLGDGAEGPEKPGERVEEVVLILLEGEQAGTVGEVSGEGEEEEEQRETCSILH